MKTPKKETASPSKGVLKDRLYDASRIKKYSLMIEGEASAVSTIHIKPFLVHLCCHLVMRPRDSLVCTEKFITRREREFRSVSRPSYA